MSYSHPSLILLLSEITWKRGRAIPLDPASIVFAGVGIYRMLAKQLGKASRLGGSVKKMRVVFACSFPDRGPGGGPSGVLNALKGELAVAPHEHLGGFDFVFRRPHLERFHLRLKSRVKSRWARFPIVATLHLLESFILWLGVFRRRHAGFFVAHDVPSAVRCRALGIRYALVYHGQGPLLSELSSAGARAGVSRQWWIRRMERLAFDGAVRIGFPSRGALDSYLNQADRCAEGIRRIRSKSQVIWNGVVTPEPSKVVQAHSARDVRQLLKGRELTPKEQVATTGEWRRSNPMVLLTVSTLTEHKGVDQIPEFLARQKSLGANYRWVLVGDGPLRDRVHAEVERFGLGPIFLHIQQRLSHQMVISMMEHSTCYLMLHRLSIFDMATLEAMAMGSVPVLSALGGNLEVNVNNNILYAADIDVFDGADLEALSARNREAVSNEFTSIRMADRYRRFVSDLMAPASP